MNGIINVDKPPGLSSAAVGNRVKRLLPRGTKIGHAGTLDPFATGVLLLLIGKATKLCESLMDAPKSYLAKIKFGATTATDDLDSPEIPFAGASEVQEESVRTAAAALVGERLQTPPAYSALKIGGQRAYDLARSGQAVPLRPRMVCIDRIEIVSYGWPLLQIEIDCGRGTYIRSIARDLGESLKVGGYLTALCRTRVGKFTTQNGVTLDRLLAEGVDKFLVNIDGQTP